MNSDPIGPTGSVPKQTPETSLNSGAVWRSAISNMQTAKKKLNVALLWAYFKFWGWLSVTMPTLVLLYVVMIAEGIRIKFPFWAIPIFKVKGMPRWMERYDFFHRIDLAIPASIGLLFLVWLFWDYLLQLWIVPEDFQIRPRHKPEVYKRIIVILGVALLLFDSYMFYSAMSFMGWGGKFSATALLATVGYAAALVAVALITINLRQDVHDLTKKETLE